jgi:hypothetical protein
MNDDGRSGDQAFEELDELARRFGTDKGTAAAGKLSPKGYTRRYARYLAPLREEPIRLIEIGVRGGASIRMWEAFFPRALIHGIDIVESCRRFESERTRIHIGDQADPALLERVVETVGAPLDVVIDDGGHTMRQHRVSLETLLPHVRPRGIYAIEDLHTAYWGDHGGGYRDPRSTIEYLKGAVDLINMGPDPLRHATRRRRLWARATGRVPASLPGILERVESVHFHSSIAFLIVREAPRGATP